MTRSPQHGIAVLFLLSAMVIGTAIDLAAQGDPSITGLLREIQKQSDSRGKITQVWWFPEEFWTLSFRQSGSFNVEQQEAFLKAVRPYLVLAVSDGKIGPLGGAEFIDAASLRATLQVLDGSGRSYAPLADEQLTADVKNLGALLKSMLVNMLGALGQGTHMFFFPSAASDGTAIAAATKEGGFAVRVGEEFFKWRLPLGSLLPLKTCPEDGERMSGAWKYCPWHGKVLIDIDKPDPNVRGIGAF